jgi:hypothetical protein
MRNMPSRKKKPAPLEWQTGLSHAPGSRSGARILEDRQTVKQTTQIDGVTWQVVTTWATRFGRPEPIAVTISAPEAEWPIVGNTIRRIPFGKLQQEARQDAARMEAMFKAKGTGLGGEAGEFYQGLETAFGEIAGSHRGRATTQQELEEVADVYTKAWGLGQPVTEAVAKHFTIAPSTAAKRIMAARKAGLLDHIKRISRS